MSDGTNSSALPLDGVRVVDFSQTLAGPYCAWLLSCLGADVIKIEPPGGDYLRPAKHGTVFAATNRNKRSVVLDLKTPEHAEIARRVVDVSDVLVESFRVGTMARLGLGYEHLLNRNPRLIYASISGFGQTGPYAARPGYDPVAQAMSGIMAATGSSASGPLRIGTSAIDYGTGVYAALAVLAALLRRSRTGRGARIDASLMETAMSYMSQHYTHFSATGERPVRRGTGNDTFVPFQVFEVADGSVFVGVATDRMFSDFCRLFGLESLAADPRFKNLQQRHDHEAEVVAAVAPVLKRYTRDHVVKVLLEAGIPVADVLNVDEVMADPHVRARQAIMEVDDVELGPVAVMPFPVVMDGIERSGGQSAPPLGAHTDEVLRELGIA